MKLKDLVLTSRVRREKKKKKRVVGAGGVEIDKDASAWAAFEMQIKCVI